MKIYAKFPELNGTQIYFHGADYYKIAALVKNYKDCEISVIPFRRNKSSYWYSHMLDSQHKVILKSNVFGYIQMQVGSIPLSAHEIETLGLTPLPELIKKEKLYSAVNKLKYRDGE